MAERALSEQLDRAIDAMLAGAPETESGDATLSALMDIAGTLRDMPDEGFKARLGRTLMTTTAEFTAIQTITPFITAPEGAELIEFLKHTFDAEETTRHPHGPDGFLASVRIVDSDLLIMGDKSLRGQESPAALHVYVKDCDSVYKRALDAGAVTIGSVGEPADRPYGERAAFVTDPFGNTWFIATRLAPDYVGIGLKHVTPCLLAANARPLIDFLGRAFGARVEGPPHEEGGRLMHAFVRIGEAMMEMAEAQQQRPSGFYMHTDNVDAVYQRAIAAGAVSILPPSDQAFGDRLAIVQDPAGNRWFAAKRIVTG